MFMWNYINCSFHFLLLLLLILFCPKIAVGAFETVSSNSSDDNSQGIETGIPVIYREDPHLSTEIMTHSNRVFSCMDHSGAAQVCKSAGEHPCLCEENESYMFSFCRKTCRYCKPESDGSYSIWRIRAISEYYHSWNVVELQFYSHLSDDHGLVAIGSMNNISGSNGRAISSSTYRGLSPDNAFDGNNETWWSPDGDGVHSNNIDWIGFIFPKSIKVRIVNMRLLETQHMQEYRGPSRIAVEGAHSIAGPFYEVWRSKIDKNIQNHRIIKRTCKVLWRQYQMEDEFECFRLFTTYKTWEEAVDHCRTEDAELAHILNENESKFILNDVKLCGSTWIGLNDIKTEDTYVWANGEKLENYTNWNYDQTDDRLQLDKEDCVYANHRAQWNFAHCDNKYYFICRRKPDELPDVVLDLNNPNLYPPVIFSAEDFAGFTLNDSAHQPMSSSHFEEKERIQSSDGNSSEVEYPQLPKEYNEMLKNDTENSPSENPEMITASTPSFVTDTGFNNHDIVEDTSDMGKIEMYEGAMKNNYKNTNSSKKSYPRKKSHKNVYRRKARS